MELPRQEMEQVSDDSVSFRRPQNRASQSYGARDQRPRGRAKGTLITAAALAGEPLRDDGQVEPDQFDTGMAVTHPFYGPGKIVALDGHGVNRKATVTFPVAGQKRFVLAKSPLQPVSRR